MRQRNLPEPQPEQLIYYTALAVFRQAEIDRAYLFEHVHKGDHEASYIGSCWYEARNLLTEAENDLVAWGFRMIDIHGDIMGIKADAAGLAALKAGWRKFPKIATGLIDACSRLRVNPTK